MEQNGVVTFRHRRSPSSDRFLGVFSPPSSDIIDGGTSVSGDELNEDEVFWTGDFTEPNRRPHSPPDATAGNLNQSFRLQEKFGILAALPDDNRKLNPPVLYRKPSIASSPSMATSSSRLIPAIPKPVGRDYSQSVPLRKFQQSVPMNVPVLPKKVRKSKLADGDIDVDDDEEMLPPHEIVARGSRSPKTTFSVLEGFGRTLKGRDLRQVRNAVWRQTGFLD